MARIVGAAISVPDPLPFSSLSHMGIDLEVQAQQWWGLTQESRHRQRLPSRPGPQSRDVAHSPAGSRWPTRAIGDTVAQKSYWATPSLGLAAQVMLTWAGRT